MNLPQNFKMSDNNSQAIPTMTHQPINHVNIDILHIFIIFLVRHRQKWIPQQEGTRKTNQRKSRPVSRSAERNYKRDSQTCRH
jgi:hypothetical protein